jgi:hypothetical protein
MYVGFWCEIQKERTTRNLEVGEGNIKMDLRKIGRSGMDCICLAQDRDR